MSAEFPLSAGDYNHGLFIDSKESLVIPTHELKAKHEPMPESGCFPKPVEETEEEEDDEKQEEAEQIHPPPLRIRRISNTSVAFSFLGTLKLQHLCAQTIQKYWRRYYAATAVGKKQKELAKYRKSKFLANKKSHEAARHDEVRGQRKTREVERVLKLDKETTVKFVKFQAELDAMVGMKPLKEFVRQRVADLTGRGLLGEKTKLRHILICGELGTGKNLASTTAFELFKLTGVVKEVKQGVPKSGSIDKDAMFEIDLAKWTDPDEEKDELLEEIMSVGSIAILMGSESEVITTAGMLTCFKRNVPWTILLPTIRHRDLAAIAYRMVQERGYILRRSDLSFDEMSLPMMEFIVRQTHDASILRERNAYLALDMLERAISRKNDRLDENESPFVPRLTLTPADFGVEMESEEQIAERREKVDKEVSGMTGWSGEGSPKAFFDKIKRQIELVNKGGDASVMEVNWNLVITGNPGTGKTTLARLVYKFFRAYGVLSKDVFEERNGLELKGEYVGQTAPKVQAMFKAAMGGCLFLDEAYALADGEGGSDTFAKEAVRTLLTEVENNRTGILVVLAGYKDKMQKLMRADPGLPRRFPNVVHLADYTPLEIAEIAMNQLREKEPPVPIEEDLFDLLATHVEEKHAHEISQHNAGLAVNLVETALGSRAQRIHKMLDRGEEIADVNLIAITKDDFGIGVKPGDVEEQEVIDAKIKALIGMLEAKQMFEKVRKKVEYVEATGDHKALQKCLNIVITGNPGTGKTTFARMLHKFMYAFGVLPKDNFVEKNGLELKGRYVGHTAPNVKSAIADAMGGCLFLDEAYALVDSGGDSFSSEAIRTLLTEVENNRTGLMVVLAGYKDKMGNLMRADPGLNRRFPLRLDLVDYTPDEIAQICRKVAIEKFDKVFEPGLQERLAVHIDEQYAGEISQHNGGLAVNLTEIAVDSLSERMIEVLEANADMPKEELVELSKFLVAADFGITETPQYIRDAEKAKIDVEMNAMIGMDNAKEQLQEFKTKVEYVEATRDVKVLQTCLNLIITGSPGTGKTTLARLYARFMYAYGVLPRDTFIEKNGLEMKGQYVGHTAPTVKQAVAEAMGGCLFLDEAYALAGADGDSFSGEAVRTLLTEVENNRTRLMVVLAGYKDKMGMLLRADPGMPRRFPTTLDLDNYTPEQLAHICEKVASEKFNKAFEPGLVSALSKHIGEQHAADIPQQNGGLAVNLTEAACTALASRVVAHFGTALQEEKENAKVLARVLTATDYGITDHTLGSQEAKELARAELNGMIGMAAGKRFFEEMKTKVEFVEKGGDIKILQTSLNMRITGNPGTGKTTLARLMFTYLHAYGILPKNTFVERNGLEMKGKYVGHTAPTVKEAIAEAMGGCLFLDEAYALADSADGFGGEAVRTLLTEVENNRTALMVVLAGYADKMENLMRADPGLPRRFPNEIHLDDYTASELAQIAKKVAQQKFDLTWEDGLEERLAYHILERHAPDIAQQNGGLAVNLVESALSNFASRVVADGDADPETAHTMKASDFGITKSSKSVSFADSAGEDDLSRLQDMAEGGVSSAGGGSGEPGDDGYEEDPDAEVEEFRRALSVPVSKDELRRTISSPADGRKARRQAYAVPATIGEHFGGRATFTSSDQWLQDAAADLKSRKRKKPRGKAKAKTTQVGTTSSAQVGEVEPFSITELEPEPEPEPAANGIAAVLEAENEDLRAEISGMLEEMIELKQQLDDKKREEEEERRRVEEQKFIASRTRVQMQMQSATTAAGSNANRVLVNPLFANAGSARKIGFAIDVSGSMSSGTDSGATRIEVRTKRSNFCCRVLFCLYSII